MMISALALALLAATAQAVPTARSAHADQVASRLQQLSIEQLEALYSLLDDNKDGKLSVHEMIDLFDGINNDALLIKDCNGKPMPHHWLGDGYCDNGKDKKAKHGIKHNKGQEHFQEQTRYKRLQHN